MKITTIEAFLAPPEWTFVRVETDEGITGWGEAGMSFRARAVREAIHDMREILIGQDPTKIEFHWQVMRRSSFFRGGPVLSSALAAIDIALWDILGKSLGVPVHVLLGGPVRETARAYAWIGGDDLCAISSEELVDETLGWVDQGFTAFKLTPPKTSAIDLPSYGSKLIGHLSALRNSIGPDRDIALDVHGRWSKTMARRLLPILEPLDLIFVEEPILAENLHMVGELTSTTKLPIATGERLFSRWDFLDVVKSGVAVIQPDVALAGGISETRRIAAQAEPYDVVVAPHCPFGPITLAASLQIDFATPNFLIQEQSITFFGDQFLRYLKDPSVFKFKDGSFVRTTAPGLGIEIDESMVLRMAAIGHNHKQPLWWHSDGSYAEF